MAIISPFKGFRYSTHIAKDLSLVVTPPYDVISPSDQERFYNMHEHNIIRIELGKEYPQDGQSSNRYTRAGAYLNEWIESGVLVKEDKPALYIYDQEFSVSDWETKTRRGLIALVKLAEFSECVVLPHEYTLSKAKTDRFNLMLETNANISQIFSLYNDNKQVSTILSNYTANNLPQIEYTNSENVLERLWVITDTSTVSEICSLFTDKQLFIADGHHRYETALNYRNKLVSENPCHKGDEPYNYVMMTLVDIDDPGLVVFPTHRVVRNIEGFNSSVFLKSIEECFQVENILFNKSNSSDYIPEQIRYSLEQSSSLGKSFGYYDGSKEGYYILTLKDDSLVDKNLPGKAPSYRNLDVAVLHSLILYSYLNIDAENLNNQSSLSYTRSIREAMDWVESGKHCCTFFLNPTKVEQVKEVSLANAKMPQKSTYFYPKVTTGLVLNILK